MRKILNISLPSKAADAVKRRAKKGGFKSTSEYIRYLLHLDDGLISADELIEMSKQAEAEYKSGKAKSYSSLQELL